VTSSPESLSEELAQFVHAVSIKTLPVEVVEKTKLCILHQIGMALAGTAQRHAKIASRIVLSAGGAQEATAILGGGKVPALEAAFSNGVLFHARVQDDTYLTTHIGTVVIPVVLALAQLRRQSGAEVIAALVAGYEVAAALSRAYNEASTKRGFRASTLYGTIGAAAASARILGLDVIRTAHTIGAAASFAFGTVEPFGAGSDEFRFHNGVAARNAMLMALLAQQGMVAAKSAFEGAGGFLHAFADATAAAPSSRRPLGVNYEILKVNFKPYPICAGNQTPFLNGNMLREKIGEVRDAALFVAVEIEMNPYEANHPGIANCGPFETDVQRLMSAPYAVAHALLGRPITLASLSAPVDEQVLALAKKTSVTAAADLKMLTSRLHATIADGRDFYHTFVPPSELFRYSWEREDELLFDLLPEMPIDRYRLMAISAQVRSLETAGNLDELMELIAVPLG
jgi:2-methylcitrate dehydratase PrpD